MQRYINKEYNLHEVFVLMSVAQLGVEDSLETEA